MKNNQLPEILRCPFCKTNAKVMATMGVIPGHPGVGGCYAVFCNSIRCAVRGPRREDDLMAIKAWNKRAKNICPKSEPIPAKRKSKQ
jgi:hypothetical protein